MYEIIDNFIYVWGVSLPADERAALLDPLRPRMFSIKDSPELTERRGLMAADWLTRTHAPAWLRLAKLDAAADALSALPEIVSVEQLPVIDAPAKAAKKAADDAWGDVWEEAWASGRSETIDAAWDAVKAAGRTAAWGAANNGAPAGKEVWNAVFDAGNNGSRVAVWVSDAVAVSETRRTLQRSAVELAERMFACSEC